MNREEDGWQPPLHEGYVLLEPSNRPHFIEDQCLIGIPCIPFGMGKIEHLMPQLIDLRNASESDGELIQDLCLAELEHTRPPYVCAWIRSELSGDDLAAVLAERLVGTNAGRRLIWRYYDPRVTSLAHRVLTSEQRDALFHGIQHWLLPWSGTWWRVEGGQHPSDSFRNPDQSWPTPDQWAIFSSCEIIHRVHTEICARKSVEEKDPARMQHAIVSGMREAAAKLRLMEPVHQVEYARLLVLFGDSFKLHRVLEGLFEKVADGHMKWPEFRGLVDEDELERLTSASQFPAYMR